MKLRGNFLTKNLQSSILVTKGKIGIFFVRKRMVTLHVGWKLKNDEAGYFSSYIYYSDTCTQLYHSISFSVTFTSSTLHKIFPRSILKSDHFLLTYASQFCIIPLGVSNLATFFFVLLIFYLRVSRGIQIGKHFLLNWTTWDDGYKEFLTLIGGNLCILYRYF